MKQSMNFIEVLIDEGYWAANLHLLSEFSQDKDPNISCYLQAAKLGLDSIHQVMYCYSKYGHPEEMDKHKQNMYDDMNRCSVSSALESLIEFYSYDINEDKDLNISIQICGRVIEDTDDINLIYCGPHDNGNYPNRVPFIVKFEKDFPHCLKTKIIELMGDNDPIVLSAKPMIFEFTVKTAE
jgi:hypothetical protein